MSDVADLVRAAVANASGEQLRLAVTAVLVDLHVELKMRTADGAYSVCRECCTDDDDTQSVTCMLHHEHEGSQAVRCWPCTTWYVVARGVGVPESSLA
jgi:hypothetical protein